MSTSVSCRSSRSRGATSAMSAARSARIRRRSRCGSPSRFPEVYEIAQSHLGLQILVRRPEPPPGRRGRARVRPVARPRSAAARARPAAGLARKPSRAPRFRRRRLQPAVRAHLHEPRHDARAGGIPRAGGGAAPTHPLVIAGGPCAFNPGAARALPRRASSSATARRRSATSSTRSRRGIDATAPPSSGASPRSPAATSRRCSSRATRPTGRSPRSSPLDPDPSAGPQARPAGPEPLPAASRSDRPEPRRRARPRERRGDARLREGLPVLPGGLRVPAAPRARTPRTSSNGRRS